MNKQKLKEAIRELVSQVSSYASGGGVYYYQGEYESEIDKIMEAIEEENPNVNSCTSETDSPKLPVP